MDVSKQQLEDITRIAACGYPPKQVAFMAGIKYTDFMDELMNEESEISIAYYTGFFTSECAVRESVMNLARSGSSPAQTTALKIFDETRRELRKGELPAFENE